MVTQISKTKKEKRREKNEMTNYPVVGGGGEKREEKEDGRKSEWMGIWGIDGGDEIRSLQTHSHKQLQKQ